MNALIPNAIPEWVSQIASSPALMTFLLTLIVAITLGELFKRAFKSRILGFPVTFTALIWIYGEIVKGKNDIRHPHLHDLSTCIFHSCLYCSFEGFREEVNSFSKLRWLSA